MRSLARLLTFDAHVAAAAGESERVLRDIRSLIGTAEHAGDRPFLIASLVALAIDALAIQTSAQIIHQYTDLFSDAQLKELAHLHVGFMGGAPHIDLRGERWFFADTMQRVYSDDGQGNGHITAEGLGLLSSLSGGFDEEFVPAFGTAAVGPIAAAVIADRADMQAKYDEWMAEIERYAALPMWEYEEYDARLDEFESIYEETAMKLRYSPITILMPAIRKATHVSEQSVQRRDALLAGIALELYKRRYGGYPDSLAALVPDLLPSLPLDRFTGEPLHYRLDENGQPLLWSVGADREDDGGHAPVEDDGYESRWVPAAQGRENARLDPDRYKGDWMLWPVVYEPVADEPED
jgi:hypothetical protein